MRTFINHYIFLFDGFGGHYIHICLIIIVNEIMIHIFAFSQYVEHKSIIIKFKYLNDCNIIITKSYVIIFIIYIYYIYLYFFILG